MNEVALLKFVRDYGPVTARQVSREFSVSVQRASAELTRLSAYFGPRLLRVAYDPRMPGPLVRVASWRCRRYLLTNRGAQQIPDDEPVEVDERQGALT